MLFTMNRLPEDITKVNTITIFTTIIKEIDNYSNNSESLLYFIVSLY